MPVTDLLPLGTRLNYAFAEVRAARALLLTFGGLALVLSAIGLYAALAFAVTQRSREIAIRLALGAARSDVSKLVLRHGLTIVSIGMAIGIVAAAAFFLSYCTMTGTSSKRWTGFGAPGCVASTEIVSV